MDEPLAIAIRRYFCDNFSFFLTNTHSYVCQYSFLVHDNGALKTTGIIMCIMVGIIGEKIWCIRTVFLYLTEDAPSEIDVLSVMFASVEKSECNIRAGTSRWQPHDRRTYREALYFSQTFTGIFGRIARPNQSYEPGKSCVRMKRMATLSNRENETITKLGR